MPEADAPTNRLYKATAKAKPGGSLIPGADYVLGHGPEGALAWTLTDPWLLRHDDAAWLYASNTRHPAIDFASLRVLDAETGFPVPRPDDVARHLAELAGPDDASARDIVVWWLTQRAAEAIQERVESGEALAWRAELASEFEEILGRAGRGRV